MSRFRFFLLGAVVALSVLAAAPAQSIYSEGPISHQTPTRSLFTTNAQFFPHIAVDQTTGNLAITFLDARNDRGQNNAQSGDRDGIPNNDVQMYGAVSVNGGTSFLPNVRMSAGTSSRALNNNPNDYGDYTGGAFSGGKFCAAWPDNSNSTGDNPTPNQFDIYMNCATVSGSTITVGSNINTSKLTGVQSETALAINPANPNNIVVTANENNGGAGIFKAYSMNGGGTWTSTHIATGGADPLGLACCDGQMVWDSLGNLFLTYLDSTATNVRLAVSTDGGVTFVPVGTGIVRNNVKQMAPGSFKAKTNAAGVDQPSVAIGPGAGGVGNTVWLTYETNNSLEVIGAQVTALGAIGAFSAPAVLAGSAGLSFGDITVGPLGQVVVTATTSSGQGPNTIKAWTDADGLGAGAFTAGVTVHTGNVGGFDYITPQSARSIDAEPNFAWDRSGGPFSGRLYIVYTDETPDESNDTDIYIRYSTNAGLTWSAPILVNDDKGTVNWVNLPGGAFDIATGFNIFAAGLGTISGGHQLYRYIGAPSYWQSIPGGADVLAVAQNGDLLALQNAAAGNAVYRWNGASWTNIPGAAVDVAASTGTPTFYALSTTTAPGGRLIYQSAAAPTYWINIPGAAAQIALNSDNQLWAVQTGGAIYRWNGSTWTNIPGSASRVAAGAGNVYALGMTAVGGNYPIYKYVGGATTWVAVPGAAADIAVDATGALWALQSGGAIYKCADC